MPSTSSTGARSRRSETGRASEQDYFYDGAGSIKGDRRQELRLRGAIADRGSHRADRRGAAYQAYAYDGFDNLKTIYNGTGPGNVTWFDYTADQATNQLTGATYDNSGELIDHGGVPPSLSGLPARVWDVRGRLHRPLLFHTF